MGFVRVALTRARRAQVGLQVSEPGSLRPGAPSNAWPGFAVPAVQQAPPLPAQASWLHAAPAAAPLWAGAAAVPQVPQQQARSPWPHCAGSCSNRHGGRGSKAVRKTCCGQVPNRRRSTPSVMRLGMSRVATCKPPCAALHTCFSTADLDRPVAHRLDASE